MHAKSGGSSGEPPDFLFIPAACRSRKDLPRSVCVGGDRARNAGNRPRDAEDGATGTGCGARETGARARAQGAGPRVRVRGAGRGCGTRKTRAWGAGRKTRNTWTWTRTRTRARARGHGVQDAGRRTQNAERRTQNAGRRTRATGRGQQNTGNGGTKCRRRKTRAWGAGRKTRNAEHVKRGRGHGHGARETGDGAQETGHKPPCMERNATAYAPPGPATTGLDRSQPGAIRRRDQSAGTFHGWTPAAGTRNNPPGPFTAGRHPPPGPATTCRGRSQPGAIRHRAPQQPAGAVHSRAPSAAGRRYLSRVRIRITPLPPRTPYMLLPRCTSTDLTS